MTTMRIIDDYVSGWNARDADAVLAVLTEDGTYQDPALASPVTGDAFKNYMQGLWAAFPDLSFEMASRGETGPDSAAFEWIMRGTNTGSLNGLQPTNAAVEVPGADFITVRDGRIASVKGYFDGGAVPRQLGLDIIVQPKQIGPFRFGTSVSVQTGKTRPPGAFSITQLEALDDAAAERVKEGSRETLTEMVAMEGFIGAFTGKVGDRMVTISAWDDPQAPRQLLRQGAHAEAMRAMMSGTLAKSGYTCLFVPERINPYLLRCEACGKMNRQTEDSTTCACGATLPARPAYW